MAQKLSDLGTPTEFWEYFEQISKIPRCSGNERQISKYIEQEGKNFGFDTKIDKAKNLVIKIPSKIKKGNNPKVVLQCHLDMVCEKNANVNHDFSKDPLKLKIVEVNKEKWLTAEGTTLGADNGVGIAYLLTLMKKIHHTELDFRSIALDLLFTVEEERALLGALRINEDLIDGKYLINLDSEDDNKFIIGCAGGISTDVDIKFKYENIDESKNNVLPVKLFIKGLMGGHSGVDINKDRANALKLMGKILWKINNKYSIYINSINGGNLPNAIPREVYSIIFVNNDVVSELKVCIDQIISEIKFDISNREPNMEIIFEQLKDFPEKKILPKKVQEKLLHILYVIPNGPISYHPKFQNLVHTSTNLASIRTKNGLIKIITSQRSLQESSKRVIYEKIEALFKLANLNINIIHPADYPGWEPNFKSKLLTISKNIYMELFHKEPIIEVIHAGLETGILKKKFPDIEMISIGPTMVNSHSPDERLKIRSIEKFWNFLTKLLNNLS
ncbi:MAG: beta-Ala-His dipeptidase [Candidatus Hodarchaeota archaeon]